MMSLAQLSCTIHIVREKVPGLVAVAIPWFSLRAPLEATQKYFLGDKPFRLVQYVPWWLVAFLRFFLLGGRVLLEFGGLFFARFFFLWHAGERFPSVDVVSKTWVFSNDTGETDFYYGNLQQELKKYHIRHLFVCADVRRVFSLAFVWKTLSDKNSGRMAQMCLIPIFAPFQMLFKQWAAFWNLLRLSRKTTDILVRAIAKRACADALSKSTHHNGLHFWIGKEMALRLRPKVVMLLYEGHAWEKCLCLGAKSASLRLLTVGYQHTVLLPYSLEQIRPHGMLPSEAIPDILLCTGDRTVEILKKGFEKRKVKMIPFGSIRRRPADVSIEKPRPLKKTLLVLPEGSYQETRFLFNYGVAFAKERPDYRVILRYHPFLASSLLIKHFQKTVSSLGNVTLSRETIEADYSKASAVLYCSSSAVLYAVLYGVKPFYATETQIFDEDVLFELDHWKVRIDSLREFVRALEKYEKEDGEEIFREWDSARKYIEAYSTPVSRASIERFLNECGLKAA